MKIYNHRVELMLEVSAQQSKSKAPLNLKKNLSAAGIPVESIMTKKARLPRSNKPLSKSLGAVPIEKVCIKTNIRDSDMNPWDVAHLSSKAIGVQSGFIEPDLLHEFVVDTNANSAYKRNNSKAVVKTSDNGYDPDWQPLKNSIWHLGDSFSQLKLAREEVTDIDYVIRIGHLDTGYDPTHTIIPETAKHNTLQRNFVDGEDPMDAHDPRKGGMLRMPGHGTGTHFLPK